MLVLRLHAILAYTSYTVGVCMEVTGVFVAVFSSDCIFAYLAAAHVLPSMAVSKRLLLCVGQEAGSLIHGGIYNRSPCYESVLLIVHAPTC